MGTTERPEVAIVGAGIGGLALAGFLAHAGIGCMVYEQASALTEVGAGIVVAPNAGRLLRRLGVMDAFLARAVPLEIGWEFRRWADGTVLSAERLAGACIERFGEETYTVHRADLLAAVRSAVPADRVHLAMRCIAVDFETDRPVVRFADGTVCEPRVLVGADGIHSLVRAALTAPAPPVFAGLSVFRALVPSAAAPALCRRPAQTLWLGPGRHLVHYPVSAGELINVVAFAPAGGYAVESWSATATVEEMLAEFGTWDPMLTELIGAAGVPGRWALFDRAPLPQWSRGTATLLGDAAHPMFPFFAQGAAQAIEDAAVLARCLADDRVDPLAALARYERIRLPRTTRLQEISHARAHVNHLPDGDEQRTRDEALRSADPLAASAWIYGYDPDADMGASTI